MPKYPLPSDESSQRPGLKPPQIGLASLLWVIAVLGLALFALRATGPLAASALVLLALAIGAHVIGNALGTRLRDQAKAARRDDNVTGNVRIAEAHHFAPPTQLGVREKQFGWAMIVLTVLGAIVGAAFGGVTLARLNAERMTSAHLALAILSCGVLGGLGAFVLFTFSKVVLQAVWQAHRDS